MSILIGIICPDVIVIASDSQITESQMGTHSYMDKISVVNFLADQVLVAHAGHQTITKRVVEIMREKAKGIKISNAQIVTEIIEESVRESKSKLDDEQKEHVRIHGASLMLAFYALGKPHLYSIDVCGAGIANREENGYATAGIGSYLANYLLAEFAEPKALFGLAISTSILVMKKVKDNTLYCGGDTIVKFLVPVQVQNWEFMYIGKAQTYPAKLISVLEKRLIKLEQKTNKSRNKRVISILIQEGTKFSRNHVKRVQAEEAKPMKQSKIKIELTQQFTIR